MEQYILIMDPKKRINSFDLSPNCSSILIDEKLKDLTLASGNFFLFENQNFKEIEADSLFDHDIQKLQGGFVAIKKHTNRIEIRTDLFGIRNAYIYLKDDLLILSTSQYELVKLLRSNNISLSINDAALKEVWTYYNQISDESPINEIIRICGSSFEIDLKNLEYKIIEYDLNDLRRLTDLDPISLIKRFLELYNKDLSLALSGGFDSRFLLSIMIEMGLNFDTISFGHPEHNDVIMAKDLSKMMDLENNSNYSKISEIEIPNLRSYLINNHFENPLSVFLLFKYYPKIKSNIIDGCNLAALRNSYFTRLKLLGRDQFKRQDAHSLQEYFINKDADIFCDASYSIKDELIRSLFEKYQESTISNWITLISFKIKASNFFGNEQRDVDNYARSVSPFLFPVMASAILKMNDSKINGYTLMRDQILNKTPDLASKKLVKSGVMVKFNSTMISSKIKMRFYQKEKKIQSQLIVNDLFQMNNDLLKKLLARIEKWDIYNDELKKNVDLFIQNKTADLGLIDSLLSYELYRSIIEDESPII